MLARHLISTGARLATIASRHSGPRALLPTARPYPQLHCSRRFLPNRTPFASRAYASHTTADGKIDEIQELYATARDEFELAAEGTERMSDDAEEDREAAREALTELQTVYKAAVEGQDQSLAAEVARRVGPRIRELEEAVEAMEDMAENQR